MAIPWGAGCLVKLPMRWTTSQHEYDCLHVMQGSIPDMTSTTDMYLQLQRTYWRKAEADAAAVEGHVQALLTSIGRDVQSIPHSTILHFMKNARNLRHCPLHPKQQYYLLEEPSMPVLQLHSFSCSCTLPWAVYVRQCSLHR